MPVSLRFSRRAAAIGAALALAALPISATFTPAFAKPSPTPTADGTNGAEGNTESEVGADSITDPGPTEEGDKACADPKWTSDEPCEIDGELTADWQSVGHQLSVPANDQEEGAGTLPKSWVGKSFEAPKQEMKRIPAQSSDTDSADSTGNGSDTDDSGQPVAEATAQASIPDTVQFNEDGVIVGADGSGPVKFENFDAGKGPDPKWTFALNDGGQIAVTDGQPYPDDESGDDAEASADPDGADQDGSNSDTDSGTADNDPAATDDGADSSGGSNADGGEKTAGEDGVTSDDGSTSDRDAGTDGASSDSDTSDDSTTSTDGSTSSDSGSNDRANSSGDSDSGNRETDADTGSGSDGTRSSDSDSSGSDSDSDQDEEKDSDKDGTGSSVGASDADGTTPDPSNGNGSPDDERETIPGNAGDEWLPGDDENTKRPDYSDPVPRNPEEAAPEDDTDLITGGDQPSPRANQNPATSFGESIISTIVSSWPVFVLAASGMAAVGFIIYLMGRRGKQE